VKWAGKRYNGSEKEHENNLLKLSFNLSWFFVFLIHRKKLPQ